jgi:hypothetical protein
MIRIFINEFLTYSANLYIRGELLKCVTKDIEGLSFISRTNRWQAEWCNPLRFENNQYAVFPLKPYGMVMMPPDEEIRKG